KTMLARALARESGAHFIHVRATDVVSKWYGEAEKRLQEAFDWARRERPSVLFFDEIDALAPTREFAHEVTHRLVSTFLENMDGLSSTPGVIVVAATNRPGSLDEAIRRPGRFDRQVEVPLPGPAGRRAIFDVHLARASRTASRELFQPPMPEDWERLVLASEGYSGADIAEAVRRALEVKVRSGVATGQVAPDELLAATRSIKVG
ncbi:MAG TPA: ATP-binding protein, partial [Candidatus Dormibacteraeota bacterium]